jgi:acetate CoA/acetoacetate CoA-transferase alpha subunit
MSIDKVMALDAAMAWVKPGTRLMMGEFVGFGEPARCIEWLIANNVGDLTLITNTPGLRGGSPMAGLFGAGLVRELIGTHAATSTESSEAYLAGKLKVAQFFPMGTWAEKVRAGGVGLGGVLVPVGVGILDAEGLFPYLEAPKPTIELNGKKYFVEEALRAEVSIIKGWRADRLGNVEFRYTSTQNQRDLAMAGAARSN